MSGPVRGVPGNRHPYRKLVDSVDTPRDAEANQRAVSTEGLPRSADGHRQVECSVSVVPKVGLRCKSIRQVEQPSLATGLPVILFPYQAAQKPNNVRVDYCGAVAAMERGSRSRHVVPHTGKLLQPINGQRDFPVTVSDRAG